MKYERDDFTFQGVVYFLVLPKETVQDLNTVTPSVFGCCKFTTSNNSVITNFLNGQDGQTINILGNGTITVSNNTNIITNTGANKVLAANKIYRFTYFDSTHKWYEDA